MVEAVYILCAVTSLACAALLLRTWWSSRRRLLLWSSLCFVGLMLNSALVVVDKIILGPQMDLAVVTKVPAVIGMAIFLFGLIWEGDG